MKKEQLAELIGNIDDVFINESDAREEYKEVHVSKRPRRLVTMVAVIALVVMSFAAGAFAANKMDSHEPYPAEEKVVLDGMDVTLVLPEDWAGKYAVEDLSTDEFPGSYYGFYEKTTHDKYLEKQANGEMPSFEGRLFIIAKEADEALTPQEVQERAFAPTRYLFATEDATYVLTMASDVQVDWEDEETVELYQTMQSQVGEISFILPSLLSQ